MWQWLEWLQKPSQGLVGVMYVIRALFSAALLSMSLSP